MFNVIKITYFLYNYIQFCLFLHKNIQKQGKTADNCAKTAENRQKSPKNVKNRALASKNTQTIQSNNTFITIQNKSTIIQHNTQTKNISKKNLTFFAKQNKIKKHQTRLQINSIILIKHFNKQSTKQYLQS